MPSKCQKTGRFGLLYGDEWNTAALRSASGLELPPWLGPRDFRAFADRVSRVPISAVTPGPIPLKLRLMRLPARILLVLITLAPLGLRAQTPPPAKPPAERPAWEREFAYLSKYREANARLAPPAAGEARVVFYGDSITEFWSTTGRFFPERSYLNRGISGQTTDQMLVRFRQDVIGLQPALVVILAGTNDLAENGGSTTLEAIENNLQSMAELAEAHGIRPIFCSVLPALDFPWRRGLRPAPKIRLLNQWIAGYCATNHLGYINYYAAMVDPSGGLRSDLSADGVHPNAAGYAIMSPLAEKAIRAALP